jgi:hypothetical protein
MRSWKKIRWIVLTLILAALIAKSATGLDDIGVSADAERATTVEQAIEAAAIQCYAIEGSYPPTIDYLVEHYGLVVNEDAYYYHYDAFASNILPVIAVYKKW